LEVKKGVIVSLGYGKYFLSDKIVGFVPIEDSRGPARRTQVYIDGLSEPVIASKTEATMLKDMSVEGPGQVERRSIKDEVGLDIDDLEKRIHDVFDRDDLQDVQEGLFAQEEND
jgi:hypothetical protein